MHPIAGRLRSAVCRGTLAAGLVLAAHLALAGGLALTAGAPPARSAALTPELIAVRAGRLVDTERGEVLRDRWVIVRGDRITAVLPGQATAPAGARVIDLSAFTVLPGLIDCHSHLIGEIQSASPAAPLEHSEAQEAFSGVRNARATGGALENFHRRRNGHVRKIPPTRAEIGHAIAALRSIRG